MQEVWSPFDGLLANSDEDDDINDNYDELDDLYNPTEEELG